MNELLRLLKKNPPVDEKFFDFVVGEDFLKGSSMSKEGKIKFYTTILKLLETAFDYLPDDKCGHYWLSISCKIKGETFPGN